MHHLSGDIFTYFTAQPDFDCAAPEVGKGEGSVENPSQTQHDGPVLQHSRIPINTAEDSYAFHS